MSPRSIRPTFLPSGFVAEAVTLSRESLTTFRYRKGKKPDEDIGLLEFGQFSAPTARHPSAQANGLG